MLTLIDLRLPHGIFYLIGLALLVVSLWSAAGNVSLMIGRGYSTERGDSSGGLGAGSAVVVALLVVILGALILF